MATRRAKVRLALRDARAGHVQRRRPAATADAGAVVVGKSTLPEFAIEGYTANLLTGVTRNPWNPDYSTRRLERRLGGGRRSGLVGVATATDGGGSIRIPASLCGLVGLKPHEWLIGRWPAPDWIDYSTDGPFATSSDDLRLLVGRHGRTGRRRPHGTDARVPLADGPTRRSPMRLIAAERDVALRPAAEGRRRRRSTTAVDAFADVHEDDRSRGARPKGSSSTATRTSTGSPSRPPST